MASYLSGSSDYIPHIQNFRPDFNFYQSALERKEAQYKEGYNKISGLYGSLLNSPMLREENTAKRDQFFKDVENNIQKISGMDLSLEENVDSAYKVFQPIIDDDNIHKDIIYTKTYHNELQRAEGFHNCVDEKKCGGKYWQTGVNALHYKADEFKKADSQTALQMNTPKYVPGVSSFKMMMDSAKDMGFSTINSYQKDGFIHTTKNGTPMEIPLYEYFKGLVKDNSSITEAFTTQAYVERKDTVRNYAAEHNISEDEAESIYLSQKMEEINKRYGTANNKLDENIKVLNAKKTIAEDKTKDKRVKNYNELLQQIEDYNDQLEKGTQAKSYNDNVLEQIDRSTILGANKIATREKVDAGVAGLLLDNEAQRAAHSYSQLTYQDKMEVDPYAMESYKHRNAIDLLNRRSQFDYEKDVLKWQMKFKYEKQNLDIVSNGGNEVNVFSESKIVPGQFTAPDTFPVHKQQEEEVAKATDRINSAQQSYLQDTYDYYDTMLHGKLSTPSQKTLASNMINKIFAGKVDPRNSRLNGSVEKVYEKGSTINAYNKAVALTEANKNLLDDNFLKGLHSYEKEVNTGHDLWELHNKRLTKNNKIISKYLNTEAGDMDSEDRDMLNMFVTPQGKVVPFNEWSHQYQIKYGAQSPEKLSDLYHNTYEGFIALYNKDKLSDVPGMNIEAWDGAAALGKGGGAKGAFAGRMGIDGSAPTSTSTQGLLSVQRNLKTLSEGEFYSTVGGAKGFENMDAVTNNNAPEAMSVFNAFINKLKTPYKLTDDKRPQGEILYNEVVAGNPGMTMITVIPDENTSEELKGTDKKRGPAWDMDNLSTEGVSILIPTAKANNLFHAMAHKSDNKVLLDGGKVISINPGKSNAWTITKTESGTYKAKGEVKERPHPGSPFERTTPKLREWKENSDIDMAIKALTMESINYDQVYQDEEDQYRYTNNEQE